MKKEYSLYFPYFRIRPTTTPIISRLEKQQVKLNKDKEKLDKMLSNENFVKNAPTNVIEKNRAELAEIIEKLSKIENELTTLKG